MNDAHTPFQNPPKAFQKFAHKDRAKDSKDKGSISVKIVTWACTHCKYFHGNYAIKSKHLDLKNANVLDEGWEAPF